MLKKLSERWKVTPMRAILILMVFALTGFTVMFLKKPIVNYFVVEGSSNFWFSIMYYILIFPVYNVILLFYGFLFGQFSFFWSFEKRFFDRLLKRK